MFPTHLLCASGVRWRSPAPSSSPAPPLLLPAHRGLSAGCQQLAIWLVTLRGIAAGFMSARRRLCANRSGASPPAVFNNSPSYSFQRRAKALAMSTAKRAASCFSHSPRPVGRAQSWQLSPVTYCQEREAKWSNRGLHALMALALIHILRFPTSYAFISPILARSCTKIRKSHVLID